MRLIFPAVLVIITALLQWQSGKEGFEKLEVSLRPSSTLLEPGEKFDLILTFVNKRRVFIPFLRYRVYTPEGFEVHMDSNVHTERSFATQAAQRQYVTGTTWLGPRQRFEKRLPVSITRRGYYILDDVLVYEGDFLGLNEKYRAFGCFRELVVYPKAASEQQIAPVFGGFLGDMSVRRFIQEDPVLTLGYREYSGREPMKHISWTQSARRGELMVKKFDYTLEPSVSVILNTEAVMRDRETCLEQCFSIVRTVCTQLEEKGIKYDFRMNAVTRGSSGASDYFPVGLGHSHYGGILEHLGRATYLLRYSCLAMLEKVEESVTSVHGIIFITPGANPEMETYAKRTADRIGSTLLILTAQGEHRGEIKC